MLAPAATGQEPHEGPRREHCPHSEADLALPTKTELGHPLPYPLWLSEGLVGGTSPGPAPLVNKAALMILRSLTCISVPRKGLSGSEWSPRKVLAPASRCGQCEVLTLLCNTCGTWTGQARGPEHALCTFQFRKHFHVSMASQLHCF